MCVCFHLILWHMCIQYNIIICMWGFFWKLSHMLCMHSMAKKRMSYFNNSKIVCIHYLWVFVFSHFHWKCVFYMPSVNKETDCPLFLCLPLHQFTKTHTHTPSSLPYSNLRWQKHKQNKWNCLVSVSMFMFLISSYSTHNAVRVRENDRNCFGHPNVARSQKPISIGFYKMCDLVSRNISIFYTHNMRCVSIQTTILSDLTISNVRWDTRMRTTQTKRQSRFISSVRLNNALLRLPSYEI